MNRHRGMTWAVDGVIRGAEMTNKEAIDVINRECERTFLLLTCSSEFPRALERSINALEKMDDKEKELEELKTQIRAEVNEEIYSSLMGEMAELNVSGLNVANLTTFAYRIKMIAEQLKEQK